ncbi:MAG: holo-ACP synthase [Phycisphaeraceae bacterium]|nr:holo-ACP synthase [Phycisphaeraceae bacterium]
MRIIGHGIDLVDSARVRQMLEEHGRRFLDRCYTAAEQAYADRNNPRRVEHLAGRFAAKEAVFKVLGTGWSGGIHWTDVEVLREPSGQPSVLLHGEAARKAEQLGISEWWISLSHIQTHSVASAIGVGR